jgi:hypothetical protein
LEQIRVRAGSGQLQFLTVHPVQQQPTRFYVSIPTPLPVPPQRMILIRLGLSKKPVFADPLKKPTI